MINAIGLKRINRKRKLFNRFKCHGSKQSCLETHPYRRPVAPVYATPMPTFKKKVGFFGRIINWFKSIFVDSRDVKY